ncbi:hypothetical protein [uncultured Tateyamaria sp.]|uniref:hypothetical protein n=1 Tax=Tateyamaria sp. 1078 TaxID=3417464 RepID=UPI0026358CEE|nr:hypothetical protein [uncultured Tateyamaria sp.]
MTIDALAIQFALALALCAGAVVIGFTMARQKYRDESATQIALLSGEAARLRRRASSAEDRAKAAESALVRERRRARR